MQTIEEYKAYTRQLEDEVDKWHSAYEALMVDGPREPRRRRYAQGLEPNTRIVSAVRG